MYFSLDRGSSLALTKQLYMEIKTAILNGTLNPNMKLPSTRKLAGDLTVSRNVVIEAYGQLAAEGYLYSVEGSGTYIGEGLQYNKIKTVYMDMQRKPDLLYPSSDDCISFRTGVPDLHSIPILKWGKIYKEVTQAVTPGQLDYQNSYGTYELRLALTKYLQRMRGVFTVPEHIMITGGAAQAFNLLSCLLSEKDYVLVENPSSNGLRHTLKANGISYKPISLDSLGLETNQLPAHAPKLLFTTPSHQFPTGVLLPIKRRISLIKYALEKDAYIIEDDYDSEFRYEGSPIQSMQNIEPSRVIYIGTFSKTLSPAIRMGYMVLPEALVPKINAAKYAADIHSPILEQLTMAKFIEEGFYEKHIQRMKRIYAGRRALLIRLLKEYFQDTVAISGTNAGLHLVGTFRNIHFGNEILQILSDNNLAIHPLRHFFINEKPSSSNNSQFISRSLIFGYGNTDTEEIKNGIKKLHAVLGNIKF